MRMVRPLTPGVKGMCLCVFFCAKLLTRARVLCIFFCVSEGGGDDQKPVEPGCD